VRQLAVSLGLALTSVAAGVLLCELLVRVVAPQLTYRFPRGLFVEDAAVGYRLRSNFRGELKTPEYQTEIQINGYGLRDDREYGAKRAGVTRVLVLGDSFTMGVGVRLEETVTRQLEQRLDASPEGPRVEVVNAGVPGYGTTQEVRYLSAYGLALEPDVVLVGFFIGNDVLDNGAVPLHVEDGYLVNPGAEPADTPVRALHRFLGMHSQLYHFLWPYKERLLGERSEAARQAEDFSLVYGPPVADGRARAAWQATFDALSQLAAVARARALPVGVVLIPDRIQTDQRVWGAALAAAGGGAAAPGSPNERVRTFCETLRLPVLDMLPAFTEAGGVPLYFAQDHHWTPAGNRRAADEMTTFVHELLVSSPRVLQVHAG